MKKILSVLFCLSLVVSVVGQVKFSALPIQSADDDVQFLVGKNNVSKRMSFAAVKDSIKNATTVGLQKNVSDITARNSIATSQRSVGLVAYVQSESKTYQLKGGISNSNWVEINMPSYESWTYKPKFMQAQVLSSGEKVLAIVGDSNNDLPEYGLTYYLEEIKKFFRLKGVGIIPAVERTSGRSEYLPPCVAVTYTGSWTHDIGSSVLLPQFLTGRNSKSSTSGNKINIVTTADPYFDEFGKYDKIVIYVKANGCQFRYRWDGGGSYVNETASNSSSNVYTSIATIGYNYHDLEIEVVSGELIFYAVSLYASTTQGTDHVTLLKLGASGTRISDWYNSVVYVSDFGSQVSNLLPTPTSFMFALGTNDYLDNDYALLKTKYNTLLNMFSSRHPNADMVLVAPPQRGYQTDMANLRRTILETAYERKIGFIDMYQAYGNGYSGIVSAVSKGLIKSDSIHFEPKGARFNFDVYKEYIFGTNLIQKPKRYYQVLSTPATTVNVSTNALTSQGFINVGTADFTNTPPNTNGAKWYVQINGALYVYNASPTSTSGLTWNYTGTTISAYNGTTPVSIQSIFIQL